MSDNMLSKEEWDETFAKKLFGFLHTSNHIQISFFGIHHSIFLDCANSVKANYRNKIGELKNKYGKQPINVLFLIRQNSKWSYQKLYEKLSEDKNFNPIVAISVLRTKYKTGNEAKTLRENYEFFNSRGIKMVTVYEDGFFTDLAQFKPDMVFYDQPWGLPVIHEPLRVSQFALTAYCPYALDVVDYPQTYSKKFHKLLWCYFVENESNIRRYEKYIHGSVENCAVVGHPKLEVYCHNHKIDVAKYWRDPHKFKIIYAPHHTFNDKSLQFATFDRNGKYILDWAKRHSETTWVFKPHPKFAEAVVTAGVMSQKEVDEYYNEWSKIGGVYTQGDYFDLFKSSDLMITDCCSFLAEYLPSTHPVIRLVNPKSTRFCELGEKICSTYYNAHNDEELEKFLNMLINDKKDPNHDARQKMIQELIPQKSASDLIIQHIDKMLS